MTRESAAGTEPQTILLVEDDAVTSDILGHILRVNGYAVRAAADAHAALVAVEGEAPAAVVLDLHLPTMDGCELLRRIRNLPRLRHVPVAVLTGDYFVDESLVADLEALGARLYFKPLWEEDVLGMLTTIFSSPIDSGCSHLRD